MDGGHVCPGARCRGDAVRRTLLAVPQDPAVLRPLCLDAWNVPTRERPDAVCPTPTPAALMYSTGISAIRGDTRFSLLLHNFVSWYMKTWVLVVLTSSELLPSCVLYREASSSHSKAIAAIVLHFKSMDCSCLRPRFRKHALIERVSQTSRPNRPIR